MNAARRTLLFLTILLTGLVPAGHALAAGGNYVFSGGSEAARAQVRMALDRSAFNWSRVPAQITIRITNCGCAGAKPGEIVLDEKLLTSSPFGRYHAWGIVQHEYAHQVDFFLLDARDRSALSRRLGGKAWCYEVKGVGHDDNGCERFATFVAWAFWKSGANSQAPHWAQRTSIRRPAFRKLVQRLLAAPAAPARAPAA